MKTTDFKELTSLYLDKVADAEHFEDVKEIDEKVYQELVKGLSDFKKEDDILRLLTDAESIFSTQGFIRGYQLAMRIAIEVMQGAIEEKERVCV